MSILHQTSNVKPGCHTKLAPKMVSSAHATVLQPSHLYLPIFVVLLVALVTYAGCTNHEDVANPLDAENLRTAGSPAGLAVAASDVQVTVSWQDLEHVGRSV